MSNSVQTSSESYGLTVVSDPEDAIVDVVFVHGLTGGYKSTWTDKTGIFWPETFLKKDLPTARILTFDYDADIQTLNEHSSNTLRDHGKSLAFDLSLLRMKTKSNNRAIVFVGHSLGGLVCMQTLLVSRGAAEKRLNALLECTYAIEFLGTPHAGSDLAKWGKILVNILRVVLNPNKEIVAALAPGSEMLANLQQEFWTMIDARNKTGKAFISCSCFYEELPMKGIGEIVPKHSAILSSYFNCGIHANHLNMVRFSTANDSGYKKVSGQLWLWVEEIKEKEDVSVTANSTIADIDQIRLKRESRFSGNISTGGGHVFQGNQVMKNFNL